MMVMIMMVMIMMVMMVLVDEEDGDNSDDGDDGDDDSDGQVRLRKMDMPSLVGGQVINTRAVPLLSEDSSPPVSLSL